ncbi:hypothetical protein [Candidatus Pristimantibacillus sp. PTI5]|uniref:hypothetical protein n=1 Tax=Candidatus Pristimantibacillus sp. PTI5 TaxID=3400422 RepID=UPI003B018404
MSSYGKANLFCTDTKALCSFEDTYASVTPDAALTFSSFPNICRTQSLEIIIHEEKAGIQVKHDKAINQYASQKNKTDAGRTGCNKR